MKKEIKRIKKMLAKYKEEIEIVNEYNQYIKYMQNGEEIFLNQIKNVETYRNARDVYKKGLVDKIKDLQEKRRNTFMSLLRNDFEKLEYGLGAKFVDECIEKIENKGVTTKEIEKIYENLSKKEENVRVKRLKNGANNYTNEEEKALIAVGKKSSILTKIFGTKVEMYHTPVEEVMDETIDILNNMLEDKKMAGLYRKYIHTFEQGKEISPLLVENSDIYDNAKILYQKGRTDILNELENNRRMELDKSLKNNLKMLSSRMDPKIGDYFYENITMR